MPQTDRCCIGHNTSTLTVHSLFLDRQEQLLRAIPFEILRGDGLEKIPDAPRTHFIFFADPPVIFFVTVFVLPPPPRHISFSRPPPHILFFSRTPPSHFYFLSPVRPPLRISNGIALSPPPMSSCHCILKPHGRWHATIYQGCL